MSDDLARVVPLWGTIRHPRRAPQLPPEPPIGSKVQLSMFHPVTGRDPIFEKYPHGGYLPVGWIPERAYTWAELFRFNGNKAPTVLVEAS